MGPSVNDSEKEQNAYASRSRGLKVSDTREGTSLAYTRTTNRVVSNSICQGPLEAPKGGIQALR